MGRYAQHDPDGARRPPHADVTLRTARPDDAEAITRITLERGSLTGPEVRTRVERELAGLAPSADWTVLVAEVGGAVVGFGRVRRMERARDELPEALPEGWYLTGVIVDARHRRRGLGAALTRARVRWASDRTDVLHCVMNRANRVSLDLHAQLGFEPFAEGFAYPRAGLTPEESVAWRLRLSSPGLPSG